MTEKHEVPIAEHKREPRPLTDNYRRVPIARLTEPRQGLMQIYKDYWWFVTADLEVLFYRPRRSSYGSPQCNSNKSVLDYMPIEGCTPRQIPFIYIPHECEQ